MSSNNIFKIEKEMVMLAFLPIEDKKYQHLKEDKPVKKIEKIKNTSPILKNIFSPVQRENVEGAVFAEDNVSCIEYHVLHEMQDRRDRYSKRHDPMHIPFECDQR